MFNTFDEFQKIENCKKRIYRALLQWGNTLGILQKMRQKLLLYSLEKTIF